MFSDFLIILIFICLFKKHYSYLYASMYTSKYLHWMSVKFVLAYTAFLQPIFFRPYVKSLLFIPASYGTYTIVPIRIYRTILHIYAKLIYSTSTTTITQTTYTHTTALIYIHHSCVCAPTRHSTRVVYIPHRLLLYYFSLYATQQQITKHTRTANKAL